MNSTNHYESTIVINGVLDDEAITGIVTRVNDYMTRNGAQSITADHWGRRRLAYPIAKKNSGYYVQFEFDGPGEFIPQLERFYQLDEQIIRSLTLTLSEKDLRKRADMRQRVAVAEAEAEAAAAAALAEETDDAL